MADSPKVAIWIADPALKSRAKPFEEHLRRSGYRCRWIPLARPAEMNTSEWVLANVPETAQVVIWLGGWQSGLQSFVRTLRGMKQWRGHHTPVVWMFEPDELGAVQEAADGFVDDFLMLTEDPRCLTARLRLRARGAHDKETAEQKLEEQAREIARGETILKQREEFLSVCAHDLRSPLGLIKSSLSMVLGQPGQLNDLQRELLDRARRQAGHALNLVSDLLDVMSYEQGLKPHYKMIPLDGFLSQVYGDYCFQAGEKAITLHYENPIGKWRILADEERIRQIFQNLFTNALKFTESGKNIYLTVRPFLGRRKTDPPYPMVVISVRDEGKGIPPREMQKIFDRFSQIKEYSRSEGRGLGLTVAKQISTLHDGNIWVESKEGEGSTFNVLFPHAIAEAEAGAGPLFEKKVLVAESTLDARETFYDRIQDWGFELIYAKDAPHAVALAFHERPGLILLGEHLNKMDPEETVRLLKDDPQLGRIPVVLAREVTSATEPESESALFDATLPLPFTKTSFLELLKELRQPDRKSKKQVA